MPVVLAAGASMLNFNAALKLYCEQFFPNGRDNNLPDPRRAPVNADDVASDRRTLIYMAFFLLKCSLVEN